MKIAKKLVTTFLEKRINTQVYKTKGVFAVKYNKKYKSVMVNNKVFI